MTDEAAMVRAMSLARRASRRTFPNPWVGAVIVSPSGSVISQGATEAAGGAHAEVVALRGTGGMDLSDATLCVTLEPCSHYGRTPPCVDAIVASGIRRVVIGVIDPDPKVSGRGVAALRAQAVDVTVGTLEAKVFSSLYPYLAQRVDGLPHVSAKVAMSLDGKVADRDGASQWITSRPARDLGHRLRELSQAVAVGSGTYEIDHPELTARPGGHYSRYQPSRYVFSRRPGFSAPGMTVVTESPLEFVRDLGAKGVLRVLVEGGPTLVGSFLHEDVIDEVVVLMAPKVFGDDRALDAFVFSEPRDLMSALSGQFMRPRRIGEDLVFSFVPLAAAVRCQVVKEWIVHAREDSLS